MKDIGEIADKLIVLIPVLIFIWWLLEQAGTSCFYLTRKEVLIMNSKFKPSIEDAYVLLSNNMLEQAVEYGKELSDDPKEVIKELETKYGQLWAWKYSIFYYYYCKVGSEMMIG